MGMQTDFLLYWSTCCYYVLTQLMFAFLLLLLIILHMQESSLMRLNRFFSVTMSSSGKLDILSWGVI